MEAFYGFEQGNLKFRGREMQHQEEGGRRKGREGFFDALERQIEARDSYWRVLCQ